MPRTRSDHALAISKALVNLIPTFGGALASLIGDYVPTSTERASQLLAERLAAVEERIDLAAVNKEEFSDLFMSFCHVAERSRRDEKLRAAAEILANSLLKPGDPAKVAYEELDHLIRCVDALSVGAITVLGAARHTAMTASLGSRGHFQFDQLCKVLPNLDPSLVMSLVSELRYWNLLEVQEPAIRTPDYGNFLVEVTPIGRRFIERFIEGKNVTGHL